MPRPLKRGTSRIILSIHIDRYAFMYGSIFYETDVEVKKSLVVLEEKNYFLAIVVG